MTVVGTWYTDQELPGFPFALLDVDGTSIVDLSSGFTVTLEVVRGSTIVVTQTTNLTLYDGVGEDYNMTVDRWAAGTLTAVATDLVTTLGRTMQTYELRPYIRRTSDSADEVPTSHEPLFAVFKVAAA